MGHVTCALQGYITSDCGAVSDIIYTHKYTSTADETCKVCIANRISNSFNSFYCDSYFCLWALTMELLTLGACQLSARISSLLVSSRADRKSIEIAFFAILLQR